jgi:GntR family transcriptional regulator, galactonate operon transcriptional repressor
MTTLRPKALFGGSRKRNLFAHVADELGARIVRGEIPPGGAFPIEAELGQEFGASRSVIREAVKSLAAKGLLESRTRTGIRILPPERWNLFDLDVLEWRYMSMPPEAFFRELFEIRRMIEPEAAAFAAERGTAAEVNAIQKAFEAMEASKSTTDEAIAADLMFHRSILAAAHNALLQQMGSLIGVGLLVSYRISKDPFTVFLNKHKDVLTAIKARKPEAARKAMDSLLTGTREFLEERLPKSKRRTAPALT